MNEELRPDPDALLAQMQSEAQDSQAGKLFLFLGMCPGVGKTYSMLQTARQRQREGRRILVGVVETHGRAETAALVEGLPVLPRRQIEHRSFLVEEFDLDAVLRQKPELVLVDELAHTNAPGSRHAKRYQDVLELLDAGIDVYTTLNVQHIESQVDIVRQITGVTVQETVPDSLLDRAHEIQLIDLSVEKLLERLSEGRVYLGERAEQAMEGFFKAGNLTALRELALRFTAERVDRDLEDIRRAGRVNSPWKTNARLMVGVGPSPYAESLIRWTRRAAGRLNCPWLVVWVEGLSPLGAEDQRRLTRSLSLARKLGAEVVTVTGENIAQALLRVARERNVSQIVVGKPESSASWHRSLAHQLISGSGDMDVCVVRPLASHDRQAIQTLREPLSTELIGEYSWVLVSVFTITSLCWGIVGFTGYMFVALVFLLAVVLMALRVSRGPVLVMATLCALCWNFIFIPPQFTLDIKKPEDWIMFGLFFIVALSMGSLTSQLRAREMAERRRLRQTDALLRVTQSAALAAEPDKGLAAALQTINQLLEVETCLLVRDDQRALPKTARVASAFQPDDREWGVAAWSYTHKQVAGRSTETLPESAATWFPLQTATATMGVMGIRLARDRRLDFSTRQMMEAFALQLALVLEKEHFIQAVSQAEMLARSEKLHRTLLDSLSHELKTPIAVVNAAVEGMEGLHNPYVQEIAIASQRLQRVVDSLLHMTQLESEVLQPHMDWCDLKDVVDAAKRAVGGSLAKHPFRLNLPEGFPLVRLDHALLSQALANVLHNATVYTSEGTPIELNATLQQETLVLGVRDRGSGLPAGMEQKVFEKFVRAEGAPAGGTGLGLAIARGFIHAMNGEITARNHPEGGAEFTLRFPKVRVFREVQPPSGDPISNL